MIGPRHGNMDLDHSTSSAGTHNEAHAIWFLGKKAQRAVLNEKHANVTGCLCSGNVSEFRHSAS